MNIRLPIVLFDQSLSLLPAAAEIAVPTQTTTVSQPGSAALEARPPAVKGATLAQITSTECCKDKKGICGCRAGKIVCCDSKPSTHPACTCHGDNGFIE